MPLRSFFQGFQRLLPPSLPPLDINLKLGRVEGAPPPGPRHEPRGGASLSRPHFHPFFRATKTLWIRGDPDFFPITIQRNVSESKKKKRVRVLNRSSRASSPPPFKGIEAQQCRPPPPPPPPIFFCEFLCMQHHPKEGLTKEAEEREVAQKLFVLPTPRPFIWPSSKLVSGSSFQKKPGWKFLFQEKPTLLPYIHGSRPAANARGGRICLLCEKHTQKLHLSLSCLPLCSTSSLSPSLSLSSPLSSNLIIPPINLGRERERERERESGDGGGDITHGVPSLFSRQKHI